LKARFSPCGTRVAGIRRLLLCCSELHQKAADRARKARLQAGQSLAAAQRSAGVAQIRFHDVGLLAAGLVVPDHATDLREISYLFQPQAGTADGAMRYDFSDPFLPATSPGLKAPPEYPGRPLLAVDFLHVDHELGNG
jgi:hypothetical protein